MTSHALGGLAGSRRTLLHSERRADAMAALESMTSYQKSDFVNRYSSHCFCSSSSSSIGFFFERRSSKKSKTPSFQIA